MSVREYSSVYDQARKDSDTRALRNRGYVLGRRLAKGTFATGKYTSFKTTWKQYNLYFFSGSRQTAQRRQKSARFGLQNYRLKQNEGPGFSEQIFPQRNCNFIPN